MDKQTEKTHSLHRGDIYTEGLFIVVILKGLINIEGKI